MGKTYRDIARRKINQFYVDRDTIVDGIPRWERYSLWYNNKEISDLKLELDKSLPNGYTYDTWDRSGSWYRYEGRVNRYKALEKIHKLEMNPWIAPRKYIYDELYKWPLEFVVYQGKEHLIGKYVQTCVELCFEDYDDDTEFLLKKKPKVTRKNHVKKEFRWESNWSLAQKRIRSDRRIIEEGVKGCVHNLRDFYLVEYCTKCEHIRSKTI